jgi:imidazolonepropionase
MKKKISLIIRNAAELVTLDNGNQFPRTGEAMRDLNIIEDGAIAIDKDKIVETGPTNKILNKYQAKKVIYAREKVVTPGLIDSHTHLVFAGDRANEFEMRLKGATYQEIAELGGGIKSTVEATRKAFKGPLTTNAMAALDRFLAYGTTTIEAKSGYGLNVIDEIKILEVINSFKGFHPIDVIPTFLGAHEIPPEYKDNKAGYIDLVCDKMLPMVADGKLAEFCDVFCEKNVFEIEDSRRILTEAKKYGFKIKMHADEFAPLGGAELAAELGAVSADHLMVISDNGIKAIREKGVIATLLPGTAFALGLNNYAPARKIIDSGCAVALATDFNPGTSFTESLPIIMTLACVKMKMTPAEALCAATINAAHAIGRQNIIGSFSQGKQADIVIWNIPSYKHIPYHFGVNLVDKVIKNGKVVV